MESYQMHKKDDLCRREKKKEGAAMYREHTKTIKIGNQVIGAPFKPKHGPREGSLKATMFFFPM